MHWALQNNIYSEEGWDALVQAMERQGVSYSIHKVVPFLGEITDVNIPSAVHANGGNVITMGSYSMANWARRQGWAPGAFLENLDFEIQREQWGERMLNHDAQVYRFADVPEQTQPFFLRPVHDTKSFTGLVLDYVDYTRWRDGMIRSPETPDPENDPLGASLLTVNTSVMVCRKKEIYSETRTWIVDGEVVTASGYKVGTLKRYSEPEMVDPRITAFAQACADMWSPNRAYVLDVADTPEGLKIVEINNLNSAGFYKADMCRLVGKMEAMKF